MSASKIGDKVLLTCVKTKLEHLDASGRRRPMPVSGSEFTAAFDAVIQAIGEEPDDALLPADLRKKKAKNGCH